MANKARDRLVDRTPRKAGWQVVRIWEHEMKKTQVQRVLRKLRGGGADCVILRSRHRRRTLQICRVVVACMGLTGVFL